MTLKFNLQYIEIQPTGCCFLKDGYSQSHKYSSKMQGIKEKQPKLSWKGDAILFEHMKYEPKSNKICLPYNPK